VSVGIVIVTHGNTGASLLQEAEFVLGRKLDEIPTVAFNQVSDQLDGLGKIRATIEQVDSGEGTLVLTDLIGSSPANLVSRVLDGHHAIMVTGINLGMLIRVCNYRSESLEFIAQKAVRGGVKAVQVMQK
jgi:PTS system ascorbate-specific IIA component